MLNRLFLKKIILFIFTSFYFLSYAYAQQDTKTDSVNRVAVYYFYTSFRCPTCYRIEQYTGEAIGQYYNNELDSGKLVFKPVNVEEKGNEHFIDDYRLYTKSVVVSLVREGKEVKYNNLVNIWNYIRDKERFFSYIKEEVSKYLKEI